MDSRKREREKLLKKGIGVLRSIDPDVHIQNILVYDINRIREEQRKINENST